MILTTLKNLGRALATFLVVTFATFVLMYGNAQGIAKSALGLRARPEDVEAKISQLGLDRPLPVQYVDWLLHALTGDLGRSYYTSESVTVALGTRVPVTLALIVITLILTAIISVVLGVLAAVRGGWIDRAVQFLSVLGTAIPAFIIAIALVFSLAINVRLFPATGYVSPSVDIGLWAMSLVLPVLALLIGSVANAAQQFRTAVLDTLSRDFVRTLRARGVAEREIIFRNVLRNAAAPGVTMLGLQTFALIGGAVFIEQVFALGGLGQMATSASLIQDIPMVMGAVVVTVVIVLIVNLVVDLAITALNPKARTK